LFITTADYIEEEFGPGFGERHIAQFIQDQQIHSFELAMQAA
jgi:hypothetical protein